ncbi:hypothetical protein N7510_001156 [Penicillium lagena]|uniref:uncharacterized protein n=1 Tax=Penicillium lagena TaxID=94218 RepID=UPI002542490F|nr:uncharacterized protein N7510_001156 [Penicillium lagena]KAJ5624847.1 hypothetical protein N7510_001156 [Penicillium lagena]
MAGLSLSPSPPASQTREQVNPTLMMSWWATAFSLAIIVVRLCGRYIRIERLFPEDKVMMASVIPLVIRMVLVHFVLLYGTNNTTTAGLSAADIHSRQLGSKLVLAARIFYAIFIWTAKLTVCEFLKRVTGLVWRRSVMVFLRIVHFFLALTLVAVVFATLIECHPFDHYWQVVPDPGPACRAGYANLITMGTCDVITDLLLIAFPVPIVLMAHMPIKRKISLVLLFCLSLILVGITCYRVPSVIEHRGSQQYRSLIASFEILGATAVSNCLVIGSFVRDRGVKKPKYKPQQGSASVTESMDHSSVRRNTVMHNQWGSDSDLAADLGIRLHPKLYSSASSALSDLPIPRPAPPVAAYAMARTGTIDHTWSFAADSQKSRPSADYQDNDHDGYCAVSPKEYIPTIQSPREKPLPQPSSTSTLSSSRRLSFFDVGGLLDPTPHSPVRPQTLAPDHDLLEPQQRFRHGSRAFLEDIGGITRVASSPPSAVVPPAAPAVAATQFPVHPSQQVPPLHTHPSSPLAASETAAAGALPLPPYRPPSDMSIRVGAELQDVGGLLSEHSGSNKRG